MSRQFVHTDQASRAAGDAQIRPALNGLAWVFARFGNMVFGGGTPTVMVLEREIVDRRQWLDRRWTHLVFAISRLTPGTNLLAFCTGVGWMTRRWAGALVALAAASVPCSVVAIALTVFYGSWARHAGARFAFQGALASAVAIVVATCWTLIRPHWQSHRRVFVLLVFVGAFVLSSVWDLSPLWVLGLSAMVGAVWPEREAT
jgi:chromate transporter